MKLLKLLSALIFMWGYITCCSVMPVDDGGAGAAPAPPAAAAADDDGDEEEEEERPWKTNPEFKTRPNSPLKHPSRSGKVWDMIGRLAYGHPKTQGA